MSHLLEILCQTEKDMQRLGQSLGACMRAGDVVLLTGEMGAGKSVLTRAAARAMGVDGPVPSPTFTILNIHEGRTMRLYHFDLYRLSDADELYGMGLDEYIPAEDGASFIEWPQMAQEAMPEDALHVRHRLRGGRRGARGDAGRPAARLTRRESTRSSGGWRQTMNILMIDTSGPACGVAIMARRHGWFMRRS